LKGSFEAERKPRLFFYIVIKVNNVPKCGILIFVVFRFFDKLSREESYFKHSIQPTTTIMIHDDDDDHYFHVMICAHKIEF
jgi:hypothetical protein